MAGGGAAAGDKQPGVRLGLMGDKSADDNALRDQGLTLSATLLLPLLLLLLQLLRMPVLPAPLALPLLVPRETEDI